MIKYALDHGNNAVVVVFSRGSDEWSGELRAQWIRTTFPKVEVLHIPMDFCDPWDEQSWEPWVSVLKGVGHDVTHLVTSEDYGAETARLCGWKHNPFDITRNRYCISATDIRQNILKHWKFIPTSVRPSLVKRIALVGAESTGKSTIARDVAKRLDAPCIDEYGRTYCEWKPILQLGARDFEAIACHQRSLEDRAAVDSNGLIICDTEIVVTRAWSRHLLGFESEGIRDKINSYDLYAVTNPSTNWEQDGTRVCSDQSIRTTFQTFILSELDKHRCDYVQLPHRLDDATRTLTETIKTKFPETQNWKDL